MYAVSDNVAKFSSFLQLVLLKLVHFHECVAEQPAIATILPPLVLALLSQFHQLGNVVGRAHLGSSQKETTLRPAVFLGLVTDALPGGELCYLFEDVAPVLVRYLVDVGQVVLHLLKIILREDMVSTGG